MCNTCNSGSTFSNDGCGCNGCNGCGNSCNTCSCNNGWSNGWGLFNGNSRQIICRDCCGNIIVRQRSNGCSCGCSCGCCSNSCSSCGQSGSTFLLINNDNGRRGRRGSNSTQTTADTTDFDSYYARQYGLYPYGGRSRCCCGTNGDND